LDLKKNFCLDDKVRVAGICFSEADVREYLGDMLGKSKGGDRGAIDAARGRKAAGFLQLHQKFTDPEVVVPIPDEWERNETRTEIDRLRGPGTFDEHGQFDPNNLERIALPWSSVEVEVIFKQVTLEYNKAMRLYTMWELVAVPVRQKISTCGRSVIPLQLLVTYSRALSSISPWFISGIRSTVSLLLM